MRKNKNYSAWIAVGTLWVLIATLTVCICLLLTDGGIPPNIVELGEQNLAETYEESAYESSDITEVDVKKIDFQPVVDDWANSVGGSKSVFIYDLERDEVVGEYNASEDYYTASLYKLFVVYEGYRRIESGEWRADAPANGTGYTIAECLNLAIRESYSPCAEVLWDKIDPDELDKIIEKNYNIMHSDISGMISNSEDIAKMMAIFYEHGDIENQDLIGQMKDSFLNQPAAEYNWRQGLPSGFDDRANVYNKVGWEYDDEAEHWNVYHDAAIVEFPQENRHFVVVVMTSGVPFRNIRLLGTMLEDAFYGEV